MKAIILAAGQGTRLRPLTDDRPKCLVEYRGKAILDYILESLRTCGVNDIVVVKGYRHDTLQRPGLRYVVNDRYDTTNMVSTLFCAEQEMDDDILISYADIIYGPSIVKAILDDESEFGVAVDMNWRELWESRMEDPLKDAETLKLDSDGFITELGRKPSSYDDIEGQYMGLLRISRNSLRSIRHFYHSLDKDGIYEGKNFDNMYMTSFIQLVIDRLMKVRAVPVQGGWLEIDCIEDLECSVTLS